MVKDTSLYNRLEVSPTAPIDEIKKKGKKLMIKWHPDKHPDNVEEATKKFQDIQEALSILENPEKRDIYDKFGMDGIKGDMGGQDGGFNPFGGSGFPFGPDGPFGFSFGGGNPFGGGFPGQMNRSEEKENIVERLDVTLEQIYKEESVNLKYNQKSACVKCNGEGSTDGKKISCNDCNGKGVKIRIMRMGPIQQQAVSPCNSCSGKGTSIPDASKCTTCASSGHVTKEKTIAIPLKKGFGNGLKMQLEGKGHHIKGHKTDLIVIINEIEHPIFKRRGSDLLVEIELKLYQALFGFDKILTHLDGRKLHLHHTGKTNYQTIRRIGGEGMLDLRSKQNGDLIIKFNIDLPTITNETLTKALILVDKNESVIEKNIQTEENLVKTIMMDMNENYNNQDSPQEENQQQGPECVQQ
jgi:DnaJ-class molecular chaperone